MRKKTKKADLFNAAVQTFAQKGFYKATLDEIAKKAGMAKGTIYLYASSKEELLKMLLQQGFQLYFQELHQKWEKCRTAQEKIEVFIGHQIETARTYGEAYRSLMEEEIGLEKRIQDYTRHKRHDLSRELTRLFSEARDRKKTNLSERALASFLLCATSMASMKIYRENQLSWRTIQQSLKALFL